VAGRFLPETPNGMLNIARGLRDREHIDSLILGRPELPLLLHDNVNLGIAVFDTTKIHVKAALRLNVVVM
jgi:aspartate/glutamate racemase